MSMRHVIGVAMDDKTCGTCGCVNGKFCLCITNMTALGCEVCLRPEETEACGKWIERSDSLEQVARDMYRRMTCIAHYECHNNDCECCIDTDCQVKEVFGYRLRELGVIV